MFIWSVFFVWWRFCQIVTLIPTMGMLAWFVHQYVERNWLTPTSILVLFIVSVLALAWAIYTLFTWWRSTTSTNGVAFIDLLFVGAFIGAVYALRHIASADCTRVSRGDGWSLDFGVGYVGGSTVNINTNKTCAMLKASFAFGIMNTVFFFFTACLALLASDSTTRSTRTYDRKIYRDGRYHGGGHRRSRSRSHHSTRRSTSYSRRTYV